MANPVLTEPGSLARRADIVVVHLDGIETATRGEVARLEQSAGQFGANDSTTGLQAWAPTPAHNSPAQYLEFRDPTTREHGRYFVIRQERELDFFDTTRFELQGQAESTAGAGLDFDGADFDLRDFA